MASTIVCYLKPLSDDEIESLNKYWELSDNYKDIFKHTFKEIDSKQAAHCRAIGGLVRKSSCLIPKAPGFYCQDCHEAEPAANRSDFSARIHLSSFECSNCRELKQRALEKKSIELLENYLDELLVRSDYFSNLSYLDCLFLLASLPEDYQENRPIFSIRTGINLTGSEYSDRAALSRLIEKGALVNIKELPEKVRRAETLVCRNTDPRLSKIGRYGHTSYIEPHAIERGIYFALPLGFENVPEFLCALYDRVLKGPITTSECEELRRLIIDIRMENFYRLIDDIAQEFVLEIAKSNPLAALLSHLSDKYPLPECYFTFHYCAEKVVSYIHKNRPDSHTQKHLFTKFVSDYIQLVEEKGWELKKSRPLPKTISTSDVEALVSQHLIDGHFNWNKLTADEVNQHWLSKIPIRDEPRLLS